MTAWLDGAAGALQNFNDLSSEKALASFDVPHRGVLSYVLDLPFGKGKSLMGGVTGSQTNLSPGGGSAELPRSSRASPCSSPHSRQR